MFSQAFVTYVCFIPFRYGIRAPSDGKWGSTNPDGSINGLPMETSKKVKKYSLLRITSKNYF